MHPFVRRRFHLYLHRDVSSHSTLMLVTHEPLPSCSEPVPQDHHVKGQVQVDLNPYLTRAKSTLGHQRGNTLTEWLNIDSVSQSELGSDASWSLPYTPGDDDHHLNTDQHHPLSFSLISIDTCSPLPLPIPICSHFLHSPIHHMSQISISPNPHNMIQWQEGREMKLHPIPNYQTPIRLERKQNLLLSSSLGL
jgi:hypothetical protein